ncbi:hypothetical protein BPT24_029 [Tenacibaculum phage pT24]|uniref:Uncharacterized protein n=1 Tax=Tenacibaculum phage pT24 TaxID=1880590 RepID=A0A1B4XWG3_9CAUD|nr:hypothetical protein HYP10_gp029 [Tenacibaculum phage pT24]BAV39151.1 hypothetical protein BPT24_029 [Tenacibaculum phage pT24]
MLRRILGLVSYKELLDFDKDKESERSINFEKSMEFINDLSIMIDDVDDEIFDIKDLVYNELDTYFKGESESDLRALKSVVYRLYQEYNKVDNIQKYKLGGKFKNYNLDGENPFDLTNIEIYQKVKDYIMYEDERLEQLTFYKKVLNDIMVRFSKLNNHSSNNCFDLISDSLFDFVKNIENNNVEILNSLEGYYLETSENPEFRYIILDSIKKEKNRLSNNIETINALLNLSV